jgi:hypothetical protein
MLIMDLRLHGAAIGGSRTRTWLHLKCAHLQFHASWQHLVPNQPSLTAADVDMHRKFKLSSRTNGIEQAESYCWHRHMLKRSMSA